MSFGKKVEAAVRALQAEGKLSPILRKADAILVQVAAVVAHIKAQSGVDLVADEAPPAPTAKH